MATSLRYALGVKLTINHERCTGHGRCYSLAPELFDCDDQGYSILVAPEAEVPKGLEDKARLAVTSCPENCLSLE